MHARKLHAPTTQCHARLWPKLPLCCTCFLLLALISISASGQVQRDQTGVVALTTAITRMGSLPPQDSVALANITVTSGPSTETGTMRITTRGSRQTAEDISLPSGGRSLVYSLGASNDKRDGAKPGEDQNSYELSLSAQSPMFPLPWLADRFANTDTAILNLGSEVLNGVAVTHLQLTNTFNSTPNHT